MKIHSKIKDYSVTFLDNFFERREEIFSNVRFGKLMYLIDANVSCLYRDKINHFIGTDFYLNIEALETNKEYTQLAKYYKILIDKKIMRNDILVTIGGGILQDISGFIASTLYRGIPWIFIPTTLLAQADSCIGSKTSINFGKSKNLIGSFYPPDSIYIDHMFCRTLINEYFNSGIGEIIKFHLMSDAVGYTLLTRFLSSKDLRTSLFLKEIILSTLKIKRSYFESDEFDTGRRNLLNYGHCFGHALESASDFSVSHGEAVIVGMGFANLLSLKRGILTREKYNEFERIFEDFYPVYELSKLSSNVIINYLKRDKKRVGKDLTMILCKGIGQQVKCDDIKETEIHDVFAEFAGNYTKILKK